MIVPSPRLLFWFTALVIPAVLIGTALPEALPIVALLLLLALVLAISDAAASLGVLRGIAIELPETVRLSKDREVRFQMDIRNPRERARRLRIGLNFPETVSAEFGEQLVTLPAGQAASRIEWACTPRQRGRFTLERVYVEGPSPAGLWAMRVSLPVQCELRVYPDLLTERRGMAAMFLHRGSLGIHAQRQVGKGRDFEQLRDYVPGDGLDEISWKATARRGQPVTKVFQIERTQEIYVIVDASRLSAREQPRPGEELSPLARSKKVVSLAVSEGERARVRGQPGNASFSGRPESITTLERYVTAALMLGLAAEQQGDLFGLITFTDQVKTFRRARNGRAHFDACRDELYTLQPQQVTPDFEELASFIRLRLRRRALLVFLTALDDPVLSEAFVKSMAVLCRQHLILVNMLPPPGVEPVFTHGDVSSTDEIYDRLGAHFRWQKLRELEKVLHRRGVAFAQLDNEKLCPQLVTQYLSVKCRQLL